MTVETFQVARTVGLAPGSVTIELEGGAQITVADWLDDPIYETWTLEKHFALVKVWFREKYGETYPRNRVEVVRFHKTLRWLKRQARRR